MTATGASAQSLSNGDAPVLEKGSGAKYSDVPALEKGAGAKASITVNLSVTIDGSTAQSVTCTQDKIVAVVARATSPDDLNATFVYSFAWRFSGSSSWHTLQNQAPNSTISYQIPAIPDDAPSGTYIEFYVGAVGTGNNGSGVSRQYRDIYVNADTVGDIYDVLTSDYSIPDGVDPDGESIANDLLSAIHGGMSQVLNDDSGFSLPDPTGLFSLGGDLIPPQIMALIPLLLLGTFVIWVLRR